MVMVLSLALPVACTCEVPEMPRDSCTLQQNTLLEGAVLNDAPSFLFAA